MKTLLKRIFYLPPLWTAAVAICGYGSVIFTALLKITNPVLQYASYIASAYALIVSVTGWRHIRKAARYIKVTFSASFISKARSTAMGEKYVTDMRFRERFSLYRNSFIDFLYIVMTMASGIIYRSAWFTALAVYYILLAFMRIMLVRRLDVHDVAAELRCYRMCGIMLLPMNQALAGIVIFMVHQNRGFTYQGLLIYAMAAYAFYATGIAIVNIVKTRHRGSPVLSASKVINLVTAMVSVLSLETAMMTRFGGNDNPHFRQIMTGATGGGVCTIVIVIAIYMICKANKSLKQIEIKN